MSRNVIGNKKMRYGRGIYHHNTISSRPNKGIVGIVGHSAKRWSIAHLLGEKGDAAKIRRAILAYCYHKHQNKSLSEVCYHFKLTTDQARRIIHSTARMFNKWREDGDIS